MNISVLRASELTVDHLNAWRKLQAMSPALDSAFFAPEFTLAVGRVRNDVYVAVIESDGGNIGFFPFQRSKQHIGRPVGWKLNDFQGGVFADGLKIGTNELLRGCQLTAWHFDHIVGTLPCFSEGRFVAAESPYVELSEGFDAYKTAKLRGKSTRIKTIIRKERKLAREIGPLHFEFHSTNDTVFKALIDWKFKQLRRMHSFNILGEGWAVALLNNLRSGTEAGCQGTLSALWAGRELLAVHLGVRNSAVMHWWVTTYNLDYERYSPGGILLLRLIEAAAGEGIRRLDLGKGTEAYKKSFRTGAIPLAEGAIAQTAWRQATMRAAYRFRQTVRSTWLNVPANWAKQYVRRLGQSLAASQPPLNNLNRLTLPQPPRAVGGAD